TPEGAPAAPPPPASPPPAQPPPSGGARVPVLVAGGVTSGIAVLTGVVLAGLAGSAKSSASSVYGSIKAPMGCPPPSSPNLTGACAPLVSDLDRKATFGNAAIGLLVAGAALGIGTTVYYFVAAPPGQKRTGVRVLP